VRELDLGARSDLSQIPPNGTLGNHSEDLKPAVEDGANTDSVGDGESEAHGSNGEEAGDANDPILEVNVLVLEEGIHTNNDKGASGGSGRDDRHEGVQE